jgi:HK97 gp10 family phage protein
VAVTYGNFTFKWEGVDDLYARLKLLDKKAIPMARKAARAGMNLVRDSARARVSRIDNPATRPPLGGTIWRNIITQESRRGRSMGGILMRVGVRGGSSTRAGVKRVVGGIGGTTPHWRHVELGTQFTRAQPFMRPALTSNIGAVADTVAEELRNQLDQFAWAPQRSSSRAMVVR